MVSQTGKQIIITNILHNISRSKGIQAMKFDQLIEYNMTNIYIYIYILYIYIYILYIYMKNHTKHEVRKLVPDTFVKNRN